MILDFNVEESRDYEGFQRNNRYKVNVSLNRVLWFSVLSGSAVALGVYTGTFNSITYRTCVMISLIMTLVALCNSLILKKLPYSYIPGIIAFIGEDILLCCMHINHVPIRLTWVMAPMLSLLYCDTRIFVEVSILNYLAMGVATWIESPYTASVRTDMSSALGAFIATFSGCTIEAVLMFAAGLALSRETVNYYRRMMSQYADVQLQKKKTEEQLHILSSMAEIYDYVNLIDFNESTEMSLRNKALHKIPIQEGQDHTHLVQGLKNKIAADMLDQFWAFTDITTVPTRLIGRKNISGEFVSNETGWFRAQYIRIQGRINEKPSAVIYTIQNIDADKRREEHLIRISQTDELTRLFNRRSYEEDMVVYKKEGIPEDLVIISADVNGLKTTNDSKGHAAGDELIRGAASCLLDVIGSRGKVYRTGGDEFIAILCTSEYETILKQIREKAESWRSGLVDELSFSLGCASYRENPDASIEDLEKLADEEMYKDKEKYYSQPGHNRRTGR
ncbi:MAG: GGDEF domain-containing protein [Erysipelotrichaceae bacterium]|nr:GGDEF domain-containing protein [Erysipelotrichaceae bacterium]